MKGIKINKVGTLLLVIAVSLASISINNIDVYASTEEELYPITLTFDPNDYDGTITSIQLMGEFLFYYTNLTGNTDQTGMNDLDKRYTPDQYLPGMESVGGFYYQDMTFDETNQVYTTTITLPKGSYDYHFQINAVWGEPVAADQPTAFANSLTSDGSQHGIAHFGVFGDWVVDPNNAPYVGSPTDMQRNSVLSVGTSEDYPWIATRDTSKQGTVTFYPYLDVNKTTQYLGVYLPADFDENSDQPYKVVYVSHGGGGNEGDWYHQGGLNNIMDNLIAQGKTSEAVVVTMNNAVYPSEEDNWDFATIQDNILNKVIPFVEKNFNVSESPQDRAFCGLSMGGLTTSYIYMHAASEFAYFGNFSGAIAGGDNFDLSSTDLKNAVLMVGAGEEDMAYNQTDIGTAKFEQKLSENNIEHISYYVPGAHDWFTWPRLFTYFAENVLWTKSLSNEKEVSSNQVYVVKTGDVLWKIAKEYNMTYQELGDYNNLKNYHSIYAGQELLIP